MNNVVYRHGKFLLEILNAEMPKHRPMLGPLNFFLSNRFISVMNLLANHPVNATSFQFCF